MLTTITRKTTTTTTTTTSTEREQQQQQEEQAAAAATPESATSPTTTHSQPRLLRLANSPSSRHQSPKHTENGASSAPDRPSSAISSHLSSIDRYIAKLVKLADSVVDLEALPQFRRMPEVESLRDLSASARTRTGIFDPNLEHQEAKIDVRLINIQPLEEAKDLVESILESAVGAAAEQEAGIEAQPQRTRAIQQAVDHHQQQLEADLQRQLQPIDNAIAAAALASTAPPTAIEMELGAGGGAGGASEAPVASHNKPESIALARSGINSDGVKPDDEAGPTSTRVSLNEHRYTSVDENLARRAAAEMESEQPSTAEQLAFNGPATESAVVKKFQGLDADGSGYLKGPELRSLAAWVRGTFGSDSHASAVLAQRLVLRAEDSDPENGGVLQFAEFKEWWHHAQNDFYRTQRDHAAAAATGREPRRAEHLPVAPSSSLHDDDEMKAATADFGKNTGDLPLPKSVAPAVAAQNSRAAEAEAQQTEEAMSSSTPLLPKGERRTALDNNKHNAEWSNGHNDISGSRHRGLSSLSDASEDLLTVEPMNLNALDLGGPPSHATTYLPPAHPAASGLLRVEPHHVVSMPPEDDGLDGGSGAEEEGEQEEAQEEENADPVGNPPVSSSEMDAAIDHELWVADSLHRSKAEALEDEASLLSLDLQSDLNRSARLVQVLHGDVGTSIPTHTHTHTHTSSYTATEAEPDVLGESGSFSGDDSTGSIGEFIDAAYQEQTTGNTEEE